MNERGGSGLLAICLPVLCLVGLPAGQLSAQDAPSLRDVINLETNGSPTISPDGRYVLFRQYESDWEADSRPSKLLMSMDGLAPEAVEFPGLSGGFEFCGDELAYIAQEGSDAFLRLSDVDGSSIRDIGPLPEGTRSFECGPSMRHAVLAVREPADSIGELDRDLFGAHDVKDTGWRNTHLWMMVLGEPGSSPMLRRLTSGDFTVGTYSMSPDGRTVAFDHAPDPRSNSSFASDVSIVDVATGQRRLVADAPGRDVNPRWSPDGSELLYLTAGDVAVSNLPLEVMVIRTDSGEARMLTSALATDPRIVDWNSAGIWLTADDGTRHHLYRLDPVSTRLERVEGLPEIVWSVSMTADASRAAMLVESRSMMAEVIVADLPDVRATRLTNLTDQVRAWPLGSRELVQWRADDGLEIEGVLWRPDGFNPNRQYPLMVVVHGGPRAVSRPVLVSRGLYPVEQWLAKGALVLMPNYRGSVGYGPDFRSAHHRTLGRGDAMDVDAGVAHLLDRGIVDPERIGLMGWSYGGFISAYLTATSDRYAAVSVGAGISDWPTHYAWEPANVTTLIFSFGVPPHEDPTAWAEASPMTHIAGASTPTLLQHVDGDPIVTVLNAYELYQALKDLGVETRFVEYSGSGHGPSGLKQLLGVVWHNLQWFGRHLWNEDVPRPETLATTDGEGEVR